MSKMSTIFLSIILCCACNAWGAEWNAERLADAIYKAENSKVHPYGIIPKYKHTTPRQACLNTIRNQKKRHANHNCDKEYIVCLRDRYCPLDADNDPRNLNKNWLPNVIYFYNREDIDKNHKPR